MSLNPTFTQHTDHLRQALTDPKIGVFYDQVEKVAQVLKGAFAQGHTVFVAGNGGSAAQATHFSDELVGRYKADRPAYPVIALTTDGAVVTCIGNDYGYEQIFRRQLTALGKKGDVFIALSTSGESPNILAACEEARQLGMTIIGLTGTKGGLKESADYAITVDCEHNPTVQELHLHAIHLICEAFEPTRV